MTVEEKKEKISLSKEHCYRSAFLVMFITFPETCSRILRMLPPACHQICQDLEMKDCTYFLKMDYSLKCFDNDYNRYVTAAYVGSIYPVLFPLFIVVVLYLLYYRPQIKNRAANPDPKRYEIVEGMRFIYENYDERCWYWEIVEMVRKLILTSGLALLGAEGRIYIGMAAMASGFYAVAHAQAQPIPDKFEHLLQLASLVATFFNLSVGVLLRIPTEMINYSIEKDKDSIGVTVLLVTANFMVIGLVVVRYLMSLGQSMYGVYKNPQCNWECCLSVILSAHDTSPNLQDGVGDGHNSARAMEMTRDDENIAGEDIESDSALPTSVYAGSHSLEGPQSSRASGSKKRNSSECSVGSMLDTPNDDSSKVPEVEFKKGHSESVVDHPKAVTNIALDSDDVGIKGNGGKKNEAIALDIPDQSDVEAETETPESAVVGRGNDAMDVDDMLETSF